MKSLNNVEEIKNKFKSLLNEKNEEEGIEHDAFMLMAGYLSEIERIQQNGNLKRKELASKIKTSASYLTQVFRGDKPLNFYTLAKIQRALKVKFKVSAFSINQPPVYSMNVPIINSAKFFNNHYTKNKGGTKVYNTEMHIIQGVFYIPETA